MNYRHAYHAGNFADVAKHIIVTRIVEYLKQKDKAFRVIDTHAGIGIYDLTGTEAQKTGEWQGGADKVLAADLGPKITPLVAPWLNIVRSVNSDASLKKYPGSPKLIRMLLRKQDRLTAIELHPDDARKLSGHFAGDYQTRVIELDGWLALGSQLPPKEKRGMVLVDPPFEEHDEFDRLVDGLIKAHGRWPGGIYALWYPIKNRKELNLFHKRLKDSGIGKILNTELVVRTLAPDTGLAGTGMIIVNPPYTLEAELKLIFPKLIDLMKQDQNPYWTVEWVAGEIAAEPLDRD